MNRVLIDTNVYTDAMRGDEAAIRVLRGAEQIGFSVISVGELLVGFKRGGRERDNRAELGEFLDSTRVKLLGIDEHVAEHYAAILDELRSAGTPIPTNDLWIAAAAMRHGLPLFSRDRHFDRVRGLARIR